MPCRPRALEERHECSEGIGGIADALDAVRKAFQEVEAQQVASLSGGGGA